MEEAVGPCSCAGRGRGMMQGHSRGRWFLKAAHIEIVNKPHTHSHTAFTNTHTCMHSREGTILYTPMTTTAPSIQEPQREAVTFPRPRPRPSLQEAGRVAVWSPHKRYH